MKTETAGAASHEMLYLGDGWAGFTRDGRAVYVVGAVFEAARLRLEEADLYSPDYWAGVLERERAWLADASPLERRLRTHCGTTAPTLYTAALIACRCQVTYLAEVERDYLRIMGYPASCSLCRQPYSVQLFAPPTRCFPPFAAGVGGDLSSGQIKPVQGGDTRAGHDLCAGGEGRPPDPARPSV